MDNINPLGKCLSEVRALSRGDKAEGERRGKQLSKQMLTEILALSEADRRALRSTLTRDEVGFLFGIAFSCAQDCVRGWSATDLTDGLLALIIEDKQEDFRRTLMHLCLLNHTAVKLGSDLQMVYEQLRVHAFPEMASFLDNWFHEGTKDIGMMGYAEGFSKDGRYTYTRAR